LTDIAELGLAVKSNEVIAAKGHLRDFAKEASGAEKAVAGLINGVTKLVTAYASFRVIEATISKFIDSTIESERAQRKLETVIKSTGGAAGLTAIQLSDMAVALQRVTAYGDETIKGAEALLLTFTRIGSTVFPQALEATMNVATALGTDLNGAALQVGKALNDPILGMTALSRAGIQFTADQKHVVKALLETGDIVGAQKVILKELENQFGGTARAARGTLGGALSALNEAFGDLFEVNGPASDKLRQNVEKLIAAITDPKFVGAVQNLGVALLNAFNNALPAIIEIINKVSRFFLEMDARANDPSLQNLRDYGSVDAAAAAAGKKMQDGRFSSPQPGGFGSLEDFFKPFNTPASDPLNPVGSGGGGGSLPGLTDDQIKKMEEAQKAYDKLGESTRTRIDQLMAEADALGMTNAAGELLKNTQDLLSQAEATGIPITNERRAQIEAMAVSLTDAQLALEGLHITMENETPWEKMGRAVEKLQEQMERGDITNRDYNIGVGQAVEEMANSYGDAASNVIDNLEKITDAMGLEGEKAFEVQKTLSLARAVVAGGEAIVHAYNAGMVFGLPGAIAFAGIAAAATAAQIGAIASSTYQSKTAIGAGGGASAAPAAPAPARQSTLINLVGNSNTQVSLGDVKSLLDKLNEEASANGMEIVTRFKGDN